MLIYKQKKRHGGVKKIMDEKGKQCNCGLCKDCVMRGNGNVVPPDAHIVKAKKTKH